MNTMKAVIKWESRKRLKTCWRPILIMGIILAVHALLPAESKVGSSGGALGTEVLHFWVSIPSVIFFMTGWYLFLVYPITSLLSPLRPPYETLDRVTPGPFARTLAVRILLTVPICLLVLIAMNLEAWSLSHFQMTPSSSLFVYHSLEEIGQKVLRAAITFPITAVFSWMISRIWSPKMLWTELSSLILFLLLLFFHDMVLSIGLRNGTLWQIGAVEIGYAGLLFFGAVKAYE